MLCSLCDAHVEAGQYTLTEADIVCDKCAKERSRNNGVVLRTICNYCDKSVTGNRVQLRAHLKLCRSK